MTILRFYNHAEVQLLGRPIHDWSHFVFCDLNTVMLLVSLQPLPSWKIRAFTNTFDCLVDKIWRYFSVFIISTSCHRLKFIPNHDSTVLYRWLRDLPPATLLTAFHSSWIKGPDPPLRSCVRSLHVTLTFSAYLFGFGFFALSFWFSQQQFERQQEKAEEIITQAKTLELNEYTTCVHRERWKPTLTQH